MRFRAVILSLLLSLSGASAATFTPAVAFAQSQQKLEKALQQAIEDYDVLEIQSAEKRLEDAIEMANAEGATGPIVAKLYIMLGVVRYASTREEDLVEEAFVQALQADRSAKVPDVYITPDLEEIMAKARTKVGPEQDKTNGEPPAQAGALTHTPLTDVDASEPVLFEVFVPRDMPAYRVFVYFRPLGDEAWKKVELQPTNAERFAVKVESKEFSASQFDYYIIAEDRGENVLASVASPSEPIDVVVLGSGRDDGGKVVEGPNGEKGDLGEGTVPATAGRTWVYASVLGGTGVGFLTGANNNMPTANPSRDVSPGIAAAFGHTLLDVGMTINEQMHLGLFFRFQFSPSQSFEGLSGPSVAPGNGFYDTKEECLGLGLPGDCILGLKYKLFFSDSPNLRLYSSLGAGVGRVRNWLRLKQRVLSESEPGPLCEGKAIQQENLTDTAGNVVETVSFCYIRDTVRTGWLHFGVGGGMAIPLTDFMEFVVDTYIMVLAPETSVNLDLSGGFTFRF